MSERDELVEYLRICGACHGCGIGADGDTCANCGDQRQPNRRAASLLERDGAELERLRERIAELERGEILTDKELMSAIITAVMSGVQSDRNDALRKVQRHIIRVEKERDDLETQCEHMADYRALAEQRVVELGAEVKRLIEQRDGPLYRCPQCDHLRLELGEARSALARAEAAAREAVAAWMIEHAFATGHGDTLTDLLAELSWQIAEIKRDAIKWRDTPIPVPPGECPYPVHADHSIKACVDAGDCGCGQNKT